MKQEDAQTQTKSASPGTGLSRQIGLTALAATGICSMLGAAINVIPFMIQRSVPGIGPHVLTAFMVGAIPAILAALCYAVLASAMPRAGGSYIYASRSLNPYLGFVASFSQWFGLSIAIGVVSFMIIPFLRDIAVSLQMQGTADLLEMPWVRVFIALGFLWTFVGVNIRGLRLYERTLVPMMFIMFALGSIVIFAGFSFDQAQFAEALLQREGQVLGPEPENPLRIWTLITAAALLFSSFIGFDAIAQAGGEAKNPTRNMPLAIFLAVFIVGTFYMLFTAAVYNTVPWHYIADQAQTRDLTAPGLLSYLLSPGWAVLIVAGAAIALINDLPAMLLAVSRLMFAWAEDEIFPSAVARINERRQTPHLAIICSGLMASVGILGCHFAGDFFLGVDLLVISMLVNFMLICVSVLAVAKRNPELASRITVLKNRNLQIPLAGLGALMLLGFFILQVWKDVTATLDAWYLHSTYIWIMVLSGASAIYLYKMRQLRASGANIRERFATLPPE